MDRTGWGEEFHCINHRQPITAEPFARQTSPSPPPPPSFPSSLTPYGLVLFPIRSFKPNLFRPRCSKIFPESRPIRGWRDFSKGETTNPPRRSRKISDPWIARAPCPQDKMQIPRFRDLTSGRVLIARFRAEQLKTVRRDVIRWHVGVVS